VTARDTFSEAALWRLLECYPQGVAQSGSDSAVGAWVGMIDAASESGRHLLNLEFDEHIGYWYHDDDEDVLSAVALAGLVELGLVAGYLDFDEMHDAEGAIVVRDALAKLDDKKVKGADSTDVALFKALRKRYDDGNSASAVHDEAAFPMFEAYVGLSRSVLRDAPCRRFVEQAQRTPAPLDAAVLLSARHFADALATGRIGAIETPEVEGAFALLGHLDRFESIRSQLAEPALRDGMVRHARWARNAQKLQSRFDRWAETLREWDDLGSDTDGLDWERYRSRVFVPLIDAQQRLQPLPESTEKVRSFDLTEPVPAPTALEAAERLIAEGRIGAARLRLREDARLRIDALGSLEGIEWTAEVGVLVSDCVALASAGDGDSAAAYLAPLISRIAEAGTDTWAYLQAARILARARSGTGSTEVDANHYLVERDSETEVGSGGSYGPDAQRTRSSAS
jgi:hypothetical protein